MQLFKEKKYLGKLDTDIQFQKFLMLKGNGGTGKSVGEDTLLYEKKGKDAAFYKAYAKLFFSTNEMPQNLEDKSDAYLGIDPEYIEKVFCAKKGIYFRQMNDAIWEIVTKAWASKEDLEIPGLRYLTAQLLHEIMTFPTQSEGETFFTRSQIAIVKQAEAMILEDLSRRITAKEMADQFGISESSFKLYIKGILGDSYLSYFRKKRMEKAAELLESTNRKVIDIASSVGYENQRKFAKVFADLYGVTPLEFRRLSR